MIESNDSYVDNKMVENNMIDIAILEDMDEKGSRRCGWKR